MVWPFQLYGSWFVQIVRSVVLVSVALTARLRVATESQPATLIRFAVYVPAALIVWPFQVYGNWLVQIVVLVVLVRVEFTVRFKFATESQPAALIKLAVYVPAALIVWPFQIYGSWLVQIVVLVVLVKVEFTVRFKFATESQPAALIKLAVYVPAALIVWPFQIYGNWLVQIVVLVVLVKVEFTVRFKFATESQPATLIRFAVYVPAALIVWPFQV